MTHDSRSEAGIINHERGSKPELLFGYLARLLALGSEIVGDILGTIRSLAGLRPELDETQARAQLYETRVIAQFGHAKLE